MKSDLIDIRCLYQITGICEEIRKAAICKIEIVIILSGILGKQLRAQNTGLRSAEHDCIIFILMLLNIFTFRSTGIAVRINLSGFALYGKVSGRIDHVVDHHESRRSDCDDCEKEDQPLFAFFHCILHSL